MEVGGSLAGLENQGRWIQYVNAGRIGINVPALFDGNGKGRPRRT